MLEEICETEAGSVQPNDCNFSGEVRKTGTMGTCQTSTGVFDLWGNLSEWTLDEDWAFRDGMTFGGSYGTEVGVVDGCDYYEPEDDPFAGYAHVGFRCCFIPAALDKTEFIPSD